jgi:tRNA A-37 threonylcarbamoyl transferase component Bud32
MSSSTGSLDRSDMLGGRYHLERELGRGGMATVYLAQDTVENRTVAVKVLLPAVAAALGHDRFIREIRIVASLDHPNIVPLLDSSREGDELYYVMPVVEGGTLRDRLNRGGALSIADALAISRDVTAALAYAHEKGIIHRDIKPENVLLDSNRALLTDFGVARLIVASGVGVTTLSSAGIAFGTPGYMSPEQATAEPRIDGRSDIYSVGCVLFEMLTGLPPFVGATAQAVTARHLHEPPPRLSIVRPDLPPGIQPLVDRCLAKVPADRFPDALALNQSLQEDLSTAAAVRGRLRRAIRRAAAVGVGAVALGAAWIAIIRNRTVPINPARFAVISGQPAVADALRQWTGIELIDLTDEVSPDGQGPAAVARLATAARRNGAQWLILTDARAAGDSTALRLYLYQTSATDPPRLIREAAARGTTSQLGANTPSLVETLLVPPEARDQPSVTPSRSIPALEAFARGRRAVNRWSLAEADSAFGEATRHDPGYARAHLWLALVRSWSAPDPARWRNAADRAVQDSSRLAPADRRKAAALAGLTREEPAACRTWSTVTQSDPADFAGWYSWAMCLRADRGVVADRASPSGWRFRSSYHQAVLAYLRAFRLHPAIYASLSGSAFQPLREMLLTAVTDIRAGEAVAPSTGTFAGYPMLVGDTIAVIPYPDTMLARGRGQVPPAPHRAAVRRQRALFRDLATEWVAAEADNVDAALALAVGLEMTEAAGASGQVDRARILAKTPAEQLRAGATSVWVRARAAIPDDRAGIETARMVADSLLARFGSDRSVDPELLLSLAALIGRPARAAAVARSEPAAGLMGVPPVVGRDGLALLVYAATGGSRDSLRSISDRLTRSLSALGAQRGADAIAPLRMALLGRPASLAFPEVILPAVTELANQGDYVVDAQARLLAGDTAAAATALLAIVRRRGIPPPEQPLDAVYSEARLLAAAGLVRDARAHLEGVLYGLSLAPPDIFLDPARAGSLGRSLILAARLARSERDDATAERFALAAEALWLDADPEIRQAAITARATLP